jgi:hypothetical protein
MKKIIYNNNINTDFTFENVCLCLLKFWTDKNLINKKIWLTVVILNKQNQSFTLIDNLPFLCYADVTIVLKQMFLSKVHYTKDIEIEDLTFQYYIEETKKKFNWNKFLLLGLLYVILILSVLILSLMIFVFYLEISQTDFDIITQEILQKSNAAVAIKEEPINISRSRFCFEPFIKMFYQSNSYYSYFPSYFVPSSLKVDTDDFNLLEYIIYNQYAILDTQATYSKIYIEGLNGILEQYQSITSRIQE